MATRPPSPTAKATASACGSSSERSDRRVRGIEGRVAVVTGGGGGIGGAVCRRLAEEGAAVMVVDRDAGRAGATAAVLTAAGAGAAARAVDVTDPHAVAALFEAAQFRLGRVSLL